MTRSSVFGISVVSLVVLMVHCSGCAVCKYRTPSGGADFSLFSDEEIDAILARKATASFPARLAVARIQEPRYSSYTIKAHDCGSFSLVTVRDIETDEDFDRLKKMEDVSHVVTLNRLLLTQTKNPDMQLRRSAAMLHADMILLYTIDTNFFVGDELRGLSVLTLGLSPHQKVRVATTASAILLDVRSGYVYGSCEATEKEVKIASEWTNEATVDLTRKATERKAFKRLLDDVENLWPEIIEQHKK